MSRGSFAGTQRIATVLPLSSLANLSVHCWAYINASQSANNRIWEMGDGTHGMALGFQAAGLNAQIVDSGIAWRGAGTVLTVGVWTSLGLARSGSGAWQVFVNGANTENPTAAPAAFSGGAFTLGNDITATHSFNGYLGPISVWSTALTAAEFLRLSKGLSPLGIQFPSLQLHLPMFGIAGATGHEPDMSQFQRQGNQVGNPGLGNQPTTAAPILRV